MTEYELQSRDYREQIADFGAQVMEKTERIFVICNNHTLWY